MKKTSKITQTSGKPQIVFFGSGPVAAASLSLIAQDFAIEAIVTKPATVNEMSSVLPGLPVHSVNNRQELDTLIVSQTFVSRLGVLIDFGIIVSKSVIDYFPLGIVNSHFSLLPEWRGADPITFSILSGQKKTGVSLMLIDEGMDTGKLLAQKTLHLEGSETSTLLTSQLVTLSREMLADVIPKYIFGKVKPRQQSHPERATYSRKLTKQDGILDFTKPALQLEREVRAFADWPKSRTTLANKDVVITEARVHNHPLESGLVHVENRHLLIGCGSDSLEICKLKPAGKNEMATAAFLAGYGRDLGK